MSKVIFKLTFKHPNLKDTVSKNVSHVNYIATRSGVDKTITEADLKKELERGIEDISSDDETYVKYINERPKSHGLFGKDGIEDPKEVQAEIAEVESFVWRGIVSLKEDDAVELNYTDKEEWQTMLRSKIPEMAEKMNIRPSNLRWVAAVHMEKGHPHAHLMFWEKEPERTIGVVKPKVLDDIRKMYTDEIFEDQRLELLSEKNIMRDLLRDLANNDMSKASRFIQDVRAATKEIKNITGEETQESVMPRLYNEDEKELVEKVRNLAEKLPGKGRIALKFMPEDVKEEVRSIAEYLIEQPDFYSALEKNLNAVEGLTRLYTSDGPAIEKRKDQFSYVINNIANILNENGIEKSKIYSTLKEWTDKQEDKIDLSQDDKYNIIKNINFKELELTKSEEDLFKNIGVVIAHESVNIDNFTIENHIENEIKIRNTQINTLLEKNLITLENNLYSVTDTVNEYFQNLDSLSKDQKKILSYITDEGNSIDELLDNNKIKYLINNIQPKNDGFTLKKYDATIIRGYFGDDNLLTLSGLKEEICKKYSLESKQEEEYNLVTKRIDKLISNKIVEKDGDKYSFTQEGLSAIKDVDTTFKYTSYDANVIGGYIDKSEGYLTEDKLKDLLSLEYKDKKELNNQYNYLIKRLENNIDGGYLDKKDIEGIKNYSLTDKGFKAREEILDPSRYRLKVIIEDLKDKDIISLNNDKYSLNEKYNDVMKNKTLLDIKDNGYDLSKSKEEDETYINELREKLDNCDTDYKSIKERLKMKDITDPIAKARDNAYNDIIDRISQVILRAAAESKRDNVFKVNQDLAHNAIEVIKNIKNKIDVIPEQTKVMNEIASVLMKTEYTDAEIIKKMQQFSDKENLGFDKERIEKIIEDIRSIQDKSINTFSSQKSIDNYLSILKSIGYKEEDSFKLIKSTIKNDAEYLSNKLENLKNENMVAIANGKYNLTNKGINEFLKVKDIDKSEKAIFDMFEKDGNNIPSINFKSILENKDVFNNLRNRDPEELKISKYDVKVKEEFGENNKLTFSDLEQKIYEKYTDEKLNINTNKAETEIEALKKRIEKLTLYGYVKFEKETEVYSLTKEAINKIDNLKDKMEFTRYDANVTLSYIDDAKDKVLTTDDLRERLEKEIVNKTAQQYFKIFTDLIENRENNKLKEYIDIDKSGNLSSSDKGKFLGFELNKVNKYFFQAKGALTDKKLKEFCLKEFGAEKVEQEYKNILNHIEKQIKKGHIEKDKETGVYKINAEINNVSRLLHQIYKEGGYLNKNDLKEVLEKNIPNKQAEYQFKYLIKRLNFLKSEGYLNGAANEYSISDFGIEKREDILTPQRSILRNKLNYLEKLGLLATTGEEYQATEKCYKFIKKVAMAKISKVPRVSDIIPKDIADIIDRTQNKVDVSKIERTNQRIAMGKYINEDYKEVKTDYASIRESYKITDTVAKTLDNLSKTLLISGVSLNEVKDIINEWNLRSYSFIDQNKIDEIIDKAHKTVDENNLWGKTTVISNKEWSKMFMSLGIKEQDIPTWIYKTENWKEFTRYGIGLGSIINDIWKAAWKQLERQRMQSEWQAEHMKRQLIKQQAAAQSKSAIKEQIRKNKDRGSIHYDDLSL